MKAKESFSSNLKTILTGATIFVLIATCAGAVVETRSRAAEIGRLQDKLELKVAAHEVAQRKQYEEIVRALHAMELRQAIIQERLEELRDHLLGE